MTSAYSNSGAITDAQKGAPSRRQPTLVYRIILHNSPAQNTLILKKFQQFEGKFRLRGSLARACYARFLCDMRSMVRLVLSL